MPSCHVPNLRPLTIYDRKRPQQEMSGSDGEGSSIDRQQNPAGKIRRVDSALVDSRKTQSQDLDVCKPGRKARALLKQCQGELKEGEAQPAQRASKSVGRLSKYSGVWSCLRWLKNHDSFAELPRKEYDSFYFEFWNNWVKSHIRMFESESIPAWMKEKRGDEIARRYWRYGLLLLMRIEFFQWQKSLTWDEAEEAVRLERRALEEESAKAQKEEDAEKDLKIADRLDFLARFRSKANDNGPNSTKWDQVEEYVEKMVARRKAVGRREWQEREEASHGLAETSDSAGMFTRSARRKRSCHDATEPEPSAAIPSDKRSAYGMTASRVERQTPVAADPPRPAKQRKELLRQETTPGSVRSKCGTKKTAASARKEEMIHVAAEEHSAMTRTSKHSTSNTVLSTQQERGTLAAIEPDLRERFDGNGRSMRRREDRRAPRRFDDEIADQLATRRSAKRRS